MSYSDNFLFLEPTLSRSEDDLLKIFSWGRGLSSSISSLRFNREKREI